MEPSSSESPLALVAQHLAPKAWFAAGPLLPAFFDETTPSGAEAMAFANEMFETDELAHLGRTMLVDIGERVTCLLEAGAQPDALARVAGVCRETRAAADALVPAAMRLGLYVKSVLARLLLAQVQREFCSDVRVEGRLLHVGEGVKRTRETGILPPCDCMNPVEVFDTVLTHLESLDESTLAASFFVGNLPFNTRIDALYLRTKLDALDDCSSLD